MDVRTASQRAALTMAKEDTARGSTQLWPWLRRRREERITYDRWPLWSLAVA
jgi:hypothetical protein